VHHLGFDASRSRVHRRARESAFARNRGGAVNIEAMLAARRWPGPNTKLTPEQVEAIRAEQRYGQTATEVEIARAFNVHPSTISRIWNGKAWRLEVAR
jgi:DNA invertase Pin-like site-specific DNA recombinase